MSESILAPLPPLPTDGLPPPPQIQDDELRRQVFTHSSFYAVPRRATSLDFEGGERLMDNEKLEHVGDGLLGAVVTVLLHDLFPNLKHGPATASVLKAHLVRDATLAQLSRKFELPKHLISGRAERPSLLSGEKTVANLFEAYVAGLYYSYLRPRASSSSSSSSPAPPPRIPTPPQTPQKRRSADMLADATAELSCEACEASPAPPKTRGMSHGQAMDELEKWLIPLFTPLAHWVLGEMRKHQALRDELAAQQGDDVHLDDEAFGATAKLNEYFIAKQGACPKYSAQRVTGDRWSVTVVATMKDGTQMTAEATRSTKKLASTVAAVKVCLQLGI